MNLKVFRQKFQEKQDDLFKNHTAHEGGTDRLEIVGGFPYDL